MKNTNTKKDLILDYLIKVDSRRIKVSQIAKDLKIKEATLRGLLSRYEAEFNTYGYLIFHNEVNIRKQTY